MGGGNEDVPRNMGGGLRMLQDSTAKVFNKLAVLFQQQKEPYYTTWGP